MYHNPVSPATYQMAPLFSQTLIRTTASSAYLLSGRAAGGGGFRCFSNLPKRSSHAELISDADAKAVERIEDVIHSYIVKKSKPEWLPFVPGASYWVPPRRTSYGVAEFVNSFANTLTEEESLSLTALQGWPSSAFYVFNETSHIDIGGVPPERGATEATEATTQTTNTSLHEEG